MTKAYNYRKLFFLNQPLTSEDEADQPHPLRNWHCWLQDNRGERAMLRRCDSPQQILLLSAFYNFKNLLNPVIKNPNDSQEQLLAIATIAGVVAHVRQDSPANSFAHQLGSPLAPQTDKPVMSELRFSQLQKSRDWDELYRHLRRAVQLLEGKANLISLADNILHWASDRERSYFTEIHRYRRLQICWAIDYFEAQQNNN